MITRYTYRDLLWLDVESPTQDEVRSLMQEFGINTTVAEEILLPSLKPKVDFYKDYIYLILHFPAIRHTYTGNPNQEVDFIIGKKFIITTRYDTIDPMHKFSKIFEVNSILDRSDMGDHAGYIFFYMIKKLYKSLIHELEYIETSLQNTENKIFEGKEVEVVKELSEISRLLLAFQKGTSTHQDVLESFEIAGKIFFGEDFNYNLKAMLSEYYKVNHMIENEKRFLDELRETNNSLLSTKQNEIMKALTIIAFTALPITVISGIFNMSTKYTPIIGRENDFWIIVGGAFFITFAVMWYFKRKKWL
ncbi:MAG: CorA family divalent cation transporter [Patescibacteria group bacterium]